MNSLIGCDAGEVPNVAVWRKARSAHLYWQGRADGLRPFAGAGARASELMGAMLNVQLDRIGGFVGAMRDHRRKLLAATGHLGNLGPVPSPMHSPDHDCGAHLMYLLPATGAAQVFARATGGIVAGNTGRHTFVNWDQVLQRDGAHHPVLNPYQMPQNAGCRTEIPDGFGARSLDVLARTVMLPMSPFHTEEDLDRLAHNIRLAARGVSEGSMEAVTGLRDIPAPDLQKFDALAGK